MDKLSDWFVQSKIDLNIPRVTADTEAEVRIADIITALKQLKNRKSGGQDGITNELLKYGDQHLVDVLTVLMKKIIYENRILEEWRTSTTILLFKKEDKKLPSNYRGINLLSITLKLTTNKINSVADEFDRMQFSS